MVKQVVNPLTFKVDWLAFTIDENRDRKDGEDFYLLKKLGYDIDLFDEVSGKNFFNAGYQLGTGYVKIFFNAKDKPKQKGSSDMHNYIFTGVGCSDLFEKINGDWLGLFQYLKDFGVSFRRIDCACDDTSNPPRVDFPLVEEKLAKKEFVSSKRKYNVIKDVNTNGDLIGETIYYGSRGGSSGSGSKGSILLRQYQKFLQMVSKHQESQMPIDAVRSGSWIRWELEITKAKAVAMVDLILEKQSIPEAYYAVLRDVIEFKEPTKNKKGEIYKNKSQWKVCAWWLDFLDNAEKGKLQNPEKIFDLGSALDWVKYSVVPTLQMLDEIYSDRLKFNIYDLLQDMPQREYSKKQQRLMLETKYMSDDLLKLYLRQFAGDDDA